MRKVIISDKYKNQTAVVDFAKKIHQEFEHEGIVLYNKRNVIKKNTLLLADGESVELVTKRYKHPNFFQRIVYTFFRKSKASRAFANATQLRQRGVDTPHEVAYIEIGTMGLFEYGYYISEVDNALPIRNELVKPQGFNELVADRFACFAAQLHEKGILHHDLNSTNVLYYIEANNFHFSVIDINRMKIYKEGVKPTPQACYKNLSRFTGDMKLFEFVLTAYARHRSLDVKQTVIEAIKLKNEHDECRRRRKKFLRRFKRNK